MKLYIVKQFAKKYQMLLFVVIAVIVGGGAIVGFEQIQTLSSQLLGNGENKKEANEYARQEELAAIEQQYDLSHTPAWIVQKGNEYMRNRIGEQYFKDNYVLDVPRSEYSNQTKQENVEQGRESVLSYYLHYKDTYLDEWAGNEIGLYLRLDKDGNVKGGSARLVPNCNESPQLCAFTVTKEDALAIVSTQGFNPDSPRLTITVRRSILTGEGWAWLIRENTDPDNENCVKGKEIEINLVSKEASPIKTYSVCG